MSSRPLFQEIQGLHKDGLSKRRIALALGISRNTVRRYLETPWPSGSMSGAREPGGVCDFQASIRSQLEEDVCCNAARVFRQLALQGYKGGYESVKKKVYSIRRELLEREHAVFSAMPGHRSRVDVLRIPGSRWNEGPSRNLCMMEMGYSRYVYAEILEKTDLCSFLEWHARAFAHLGGVPWEILYDRKCNPLLRRYCGETGFNHSLHGLAHHYGFTPMNWPTSTLDASDSLAGKALLEASRADSEEDRRIANERLASWLSDWARRPMARGGESIQERFARERASLRALPASPFDSAERHFRIVLRKGVIPFRGSSFRVPAAAEGKLVLLLIQRGSVRVLLENKLIANFRIGNGSKPRRRMDQFRYY